MHKNHSVYENDFYFSEDFQSLVFIPPADFDIALEYYSIATGTILKDGENPGRLWDIMRQAAPFVVVGVCIAGCVIFLLVRHKRKS